MVYFLANFGLFYLTAYTKVENEVIQFFKDNCPLYFDRFIEDVEYLKNCRNKCAHLKVNDNTLFVPNDYHARMLICSMYDNILSVKAPFIMDLFSIAQPDIENYADSLSYIPSDGLDEAIKIGITKKYLCRMTYDSLKKSYKTFLRLLFVTDDEDCVKNAGGLYAFTYAMTDYIVKNGFLNLFSESVIMDMFAKIEVERLEASSTRRNALISIMVAYPAVMDLVRSNDAVFQYASKRVLSKPHGLNYYRTFYPRDEKTVFGFFKDSSDIHQPSSINALYSVVSESDDFDFAEFIMIMVKSIPTFNGFHDADCFTSFFKEHLADFTVETIEAVMKQYRSNGQCTNRGRHSADVEEINKYIAEQASDSGAETDDEDLPF